MPTPLRVGKLANCINTRIKKPPFLRNMKATTNRYLLGNAQWKESFSKHLWFAFVIVFFWLEWAGYLAVAGLNLLAQISDRISPFGV